MFPACNFNKQADDTMTPQLTLDLASGIDQAVRNVGSQAKLAALLRSRFPGKHHPSQQAISQWVRRGYVPLERAQEVAAIGNVPVRSLVSPAVRELVTP